MKTITFNELRKIKDALPVGSMHRIADELGLEVDTLRNFFGGHNSFRFGIKNIRRNYKLKFVEWKICEYVVLFLY